MGSSVIPPEDRLGPGGPVSVETLLRVCQAKLANPLASQELLGNILNCDHNTVYNALHTPYGQRLIQNAKETVEAYADRLRAIQGDSVEYWNKSVQRGHQELDKPNPSGPVLTNAVRATELTSKTTGLLKDTIRVNAELRGPTEYDDLPALAADAAVLAFLEGHDQDGGGPGLALTDESGAMGTGEALDDDIEAGPSEPDSSGAGQQGVEGEAAKRPSGATDGTLPSTS